MDRINKYSLICLNELAVEENGGRFDGLYAGSWHSSEIFTFGY